MNSKLISYHYLLIVLLLEINESSSLEFNNFLSHFSLDGWSSFSFYSTDIDTQY